MKEVPKKENAPQEHKKPMGKNMLPGGGRKVKANGRMDDSMETDIILWPTWAQSA
jgi:hypothetical protein